MAHKTITIALFDDELAADRAGMSLADGRFITEDAIGVLALDSDGKLKVDKLGARSTKAGVGIGAVLWLLGPVGIGAGLIGGGVLGALHHKGLGLDESDRTRITEELQGGRAAVGVLSAAEDAEAVAAHLKALGGTPETHDAPDDALEHAASTPGPEADPEVPVR